MNKFVIKLFINRVRDLISRLS